MAGKYDTSFKELVSHHFVTLLPWLLPGVRGEVVRLSEELPLTLRRADLIFRSEQGGTPPTLFLLECQCQYDADLPLDMLLRAALAHRQYRLPVETILLAFTPQAAAAEEYIFGGRGEHRCRHFVSVRRIYEEPAESALCMGISSLLPLVTAMQPADGDRAELLAKVLERIIDLGETTNGSATDELHPPVTDAQRKLMLDQAATFATLHLSKHQVQGIVRSVVERRHYMLDPIRDFPWLRAGYEEGIEKGKTVGVAESVLAVLAARNLTVDARLRERISGCQDPKLLSRWLSRAATVSSADDVLGDN